MRNYPNPDYFWWKDGVIYQIYPRSFMDTNGDGVGDLPGITARLDYLADLGVDALWLSPVNRSPMHDFGYDVADYEEIDPIFGSLADLDHLITEAHRRGLRIMLDLVLNHSSDEHAWFQESRVSRTNPKADWYLWHDPVPGKEYPNNWISVFGGPAWEWDSTRGQFYYHMFLKEQPDLNWRNPETRAALMKILKVWLERGVDGFRLDVVNAYFKDDQWRDNPENPIADENSVRRQRQLHVYDKDRPELHDVFREIRSLLDSYAERACVGEVLGGDDPGFVARYLGNGNDQLNMAFSWGFTIQPWEPNAIQQAVLAADAAAAFNTWPCYVFSNHDSIRHVTRHGGGIYAEARAKVSAMLLLTLRGTPFLYMGEEIAMPSSIIAEDDKQDPAGRDHSRTPMQWDTSTNAGFTTGKPWLPVDPSFKTLNVAAQKADPHSALNFYRELLYLRRASPALRRGRFRPLIDRPTSALAYLRETDGQRMFVALNFFEQEATVPLPQGRWTRKLSTHFNAGDFISGESLTLVPFEASLFSADVPLQ